MCVYSCTYFGLNDENPKVTFCRGFWTPVAYLKTGTSGRPVISIEAQVRSSYAPGEASRVVLEPPLEADHSEALLPFPGRARSPDCSHASPSCSCLQGVRCGIDYLNTSSINAPSMGGLVIGGKAAIHLLLAGLCFGKLTPIVFSLAWLCSTTVRQPGQSCLRRGPAATC